MGPERWWRRGTRQRVGLKELGCTSRLLVPGAAVANALHAASAAAAQSPTAGARNSDDADSSKRRQQGKTGGGARGEAKVAHLWGWGGGGGVPRMRQYHHASNALWRRGVVREPTIQAHGRGGWVACHGTCSWMAGLTIVLR